MIRQFSDKKSLNIVVMLKYMFCNTQNLTLLNWCEIVTNVVFTRITSVTAGNHVTQQQQQ